MELMTIPYYRETMGSLDPWTNVHKFINWGHSAGNGSLEDDLNDWRDSRIILVNVSSIEILFQAWFQKRELISK